MREKTGERTRLGRAAALRRSLLCSLPPYTAARNDRMPTSADGYLKIVHCLRKDILSRLGCQISFAARRNLQEGRQAYNYPQCPHPERERQAPDH